MSTRTIETKSGTVRFDTALKFMRDDIIEHMANDPWNYMYGDQGVYDTYIRLVTILDPNFTDWSWLAVLNDEIYADYIQADVEPGQSRRYCDQLEGINHLAKSYREDRTRTEILELL